MSQIKEYKFECKEALFDELLQDVMDGLSAAVENKPEASMLLSGGTSPGALYNMMSQQAFDWEKVHFGLSDERWVSPDCDDSNEKLVKETLLINNAKSANFIGLKSTDKDIVLGQATSDKNLKNLPAPFDIVLLGMGLDGHTASLFPDSSDTAQALDVDNKMLCHPIRRGQDETPRMTMTLNALLNAQEIKLLIFGDEKWQVYQQAKAEKSTNQPVSYILNQTDVPVSVYWAS